MPNWVEQDLHVVGPKLEVDRFMRTGFVRHKRGEIDDLLDFMRLCPLKRRERKDTYTHPSGVVLINFRTRTQACLSMITSWDYPAEFYARLAKHWPTLGFACSVNEEMGQFGGILIVAHGEVVNLVRDYAMNYNRRSHGREIRSLLKRWNEFLTAERPYRLFSPLAWKHRSMPFDAHFDDDFWFYFRTREEVTRFKARFKSSHLMRRSDGEWRPARA